jgi:membrane-associated phospholipid phosphatase
LPGAPLLSRVEVRIGIGFWVVAGATAALRGAGRDYLVYAVPVIAVAAACLWMRRTRIGGLLADWLPLPFVVFTYEMLHRVVPLCWKGTIDARLAAIDRALLGGDAAVLLEPIVSPPLTFLMACFYASYYPILIGLALWFLARRRRQAFREFVAGVIGSLFLGFLGYLFLPAIGPHAWFPASTWHVALEGDFIGPAIRTLNANHHGEFPRDVFPSLHTANAVTALLVAHLHDRRAFRFYLVPCLGLIAATVYLRWHYVVDLVAGAVLAIVWQAFVPRLVARETAQETPPAVT